MGRVPRARRPLGAPPRRDPARDLLNAPFEGLLDVLVVGAGQAGLATGYWLRRLAPDLRVAIVDAAPELGETWRWRWESLRLFTPRAFSALPGLPFPAGSTPCPERLEMAAYLQNYAGHCCVKRRQPAITARSSAHQSETDPQ
ncbi:MAG: hypothetical protein M3R66_18855 [Actinomycetota bacterium]|nr:hypothetical protein [Actinomycetota bacterium]